MGIIGGAYWVRVSEEFPRVGRTQCKDIANLELPIAENFSEADASAKRRVIECRIGGAWIEHHKEKASISPARVHRSPQRIPIVPVDYRSLPGAHDFEPAPKTHLPLPHELAAPALVGPGVQASSK
jgi:hypothetical protein